MTNNKHEQYSFAALHNRLRVTGQLVAETALRIGSGRESGVTGSDLPVLRDGRGRPFIPGASLKGAFRARVEGLVRAVASEQARDLLEIEDVMRDRIGLLAQRLRRNRNIATADQTFHNDVIDLSTLIELTFGAPWIAGRVFFKDAHVDETLWFDQWEVRNGVALNRDTETVEQGHLYNYEVVPAGVRFGFELLMENAEPWQLGMVLLALKPWERGEVQIGGFRSRGLGHVRLTNVERRFYELRRGNVDDLLALVGYDQSPVGTLVDEQHAAPWYAAFRDELIARADQGAPQGVGDA